MTQHLDPNPPIPLYERPTDYKQTQSIFVQQISTNRTFLDNPHLHRHLFYEWVLITKGSGQHYIDMACYEIKKNRIFFLSPQQVHMVKGNSAIDGYNISFVKDNAFTVDLDLFLLELQTKPYIDLSDEDMASFQGVLHIISQELSHGASVHTLIHFLLNALCSIIKRHGLNRTIAAASALTPLFFIELKREVSASRTINDISESLSVSADYLNQVVKAETMQDARYWLKQMVVLESQRLVVFTTMSIENISMKLGFQDVSYFYKYFKRHMSQTPLQYRKQYRHTYAEIDFNKGVRL